MTNICRLCLSEVLQCTNESDKSILHMEKIKSLIPEIDISIIPTFILCLECSQSLNSAYTFRCACIQTESLIKEYVNHTKSTVFDLQDIRKQILCKEKNCQEDIKIEISDVNVVTEHIVGVTDIKNENSFNLICEKCHKSFDSCDQLQKHIQTCLPYPCGQCKESFSNKEDFDEHQVAHDKAKLFFCDICKRYFKRRYDMKRHRVNVHSVSKVSLRCNECSKVFPNEKSLERHRLAHLNTKQTYVCDVCNKGYDKLVTLVRHKELHADKKFNCTICPKFFNGSDNLRRHMINVHFGSYICGTCGMKCGSNHALEEHVRTHTGEKPYKCENCGKGFAQQSSLRVHKQCTHNTARPYICKKCGKGFTLSTYLRLHEETHVASIEKKFLCRVCNKKFGTNRNLREHARRHLGQKNHKCLLCSKEFLTRHSLKKHMMTHTGEKPYECHTCQKRFSQKYNLQVHFRSHNPKTKVSKKAH